MNITEVSEEFDDHGDEDEDPPPKKQKRLSLLNAEELELEEESVGPTPAQPTKRRMTTATTATAKKSKKKKSNNVWTKPTSRKGQKKTKNNNHNAPTENTVLITPVPRFPDKADDTLGMKIFLSKVYKAEKVELGDDQLSVGNTNGYRIVRATRGVVERAWYIEIRVACLGETGHTRLGWSMEKGICRLRLDTNSFGYRDIDGSKVHKVLR